MHACFDAATATGAVAAVAYLEMDDWIFSRFRITDAKICSKEELCVRVCVCLIN